MALSSLANKFVNSEPGVEHDEHGGAEQDDAPDAGHGRGQGQRVHQRVPQGEDGQCLPGLTMIHVMLVSWSTYSKLEVNALPPSPKEYFLHKNLN